MSSSSLSWVYSVELKSGIESLLCEIVWGGMRGWQVKGSEGVVGERTDDERAVGRAGLRAGGGCDAIGA